MSECSSVFYTDRVNYIKDQELDDTRMAYGFGSVQELVVKIERDLIRALSIILEHDLISA